MSARAQFAWSIRRELWENRSLYLAPLAIAVLAVVAFITHAGQYAEGVRALPTSPHAAVRPFSFIAAAVLFVSWVASLFYALDALHGERRDRSILFWKSMPVSDVVTVFAKAAMTVVVVPVLACGIALAAQLLMALVAGVALAAKGVGPGVLASVPWVQMTVGMLWGMGVHALWYAPVFGYALLVSAWAPRAIFLWAFLPIFGAYALETIALGTKHVLTFLQWRFLGGMLYAFEPGALQGPVTSIAQLDPARFFATPGLWVGLGFAALCLYGAIRLRRYREPA